MGLKKPFSITLLIVGLFGLASCGSDEPEDLGPCNLIYPV